jgi:hypothetical protein
VKSGAKINIWCDPWIPRPHRWVAQLMKANMREWDEGVIRSCMYPIDADEVLKIRLTDRGDEDCIAWHYEKSGLFTVRSAYKLALKRDQANRWQVGSSSRADGSRKVYNEIWTVHVPPKVRIFVWKFALDGLATQCNRKCRTLTDDATCRICG